MVTGIKLILHTGHADSTIAILNCQDVQMIFSTNICLDHILPDPGLLCTYFHNREIIAQFNIVKHAVAAY